ncbi:5-deoxy-glucuronate isomerase [Ideonella sp. DXS29W]|uniref:5-deoxy-glucuronate isomerase n=1 Tax=Ideonella lacteola TaxID=2984193 RepID=A0ABU9BSY2_9BURK
MSPLLVKARRDGREIVQVTPQSAGWTHVGFRALRLRAGDQEMLSTGDRELCVVVLAGRASMEAGDQRFDGLGSRQSVFDDAPPVALYVPKHTALKISADSDAELALCTAPADDQPREVTLLPAEGMKRSVRGQGSNTRYVCDILPHTHPAAAHLLVVEVRTPAGHSSSYPPHKHDTEALPAETQLEETYYHRIHPPQGFAFQRVYTDDRTLDEAMAVEDHDVVLVPRGYHPVVAPHGYDLYYLNVMGGPGRHWVFRNDPAHEWMLAPTPT